MQMEKNPEQNEVTTTEDEVDKMIETSLLNMFPSNSKHCIYTVPEHMKKGKEECYEPLVISIGPVFYNNEDPKLKPMQELKKIYLKSFRDHSINASQGLKRCIKYVREHEREICECYEKLINLPSNEFIEMIVLDAVFLIYYFLAICFNNVVNQPSIGNKLQLLMQRLMRDLVLEENQLPVFVLKDIYNTVFNEVFELPCSFTELALLFICNLPTGFHFPGPKASTSLQEVSKEITDESCIQHLVDLWLICCFLLTKNQRQISRDSERCVPEGIKSVINATKCRVDLGRMCSCLPFYQRPHPVRQKPEPDFLNFGSAMHLSAAGVIFEASDSHNLMDITFDKKKGVLKIPKLTLEDDTESALRSILFFEQRHYISHDIFLITNYTIFLDTLIDTVDDVQVLQKKKIIDNQLGSDQDVIDLFNNLNKNIVCNLSACSNFSDVRKMLKAYTSSRKNKWKAILWRKYFNHPWAIISVIYAVILLILTLLQTITDFLQVT